jgi:glycosyltransferase involved in cell wall biosynthesis
MFTKRPKITLTTSFPIFPPTNIKSRRIFHLYRHLTQKFDIEIISLTENNQPYFQGEIAPGLRETRIPKTAEHQTAEIELTSKLGTSLNDVTLIKLYSLTPNYLQTLKKSTKNADILLLYQPYLFPALREVSNKPFWYEASGIEAELAKQFLPDNNLGHEFGELIQKIEEKCCQTSRLIITAAEHDTQELKRIYQLDSQKIIDIPNGMTSKKVNYIDYEQRTINKQKLGLQESFLAIFTATGHPHNGDEARLILNLASKLPEIKFLILGNVGVTFEPRLTPSNVGFIKSLDEPTKSLILGLADVALNPVKASSNTLPNILEYFCAGIPVISTYQGMKGLNIEPAKYCLVGDFWRFPEMLLSICREDVLTKKIRIEQAKQYAQKQFDWWKIADSFLHNFQLAF